MNAIIKKVASLALLASVVSAWTPNASAATRTVKLPVKTVLSSTFNLFNCSNFVSCLSNFNELDDGDIGVGAFAKNNAVMTLRHFKISEVAAVNWSQATSVTGVRLYYGAQATQGTACGSFATLVHSQSFEGLGTQENRCLNSGAGVRFSLPLRAGDDGSGNLGWTVAKVSDADFVSTVFRNAPFGPRFYVAELYIQVTYTTP